MVAILATVVIQCKSLMRKCLTKNQRTTITLLKFNHQFSNHTHTHRHTQMHTNTHRHTQTHAHTYTHRHTHKYTHTHTHTHTQTHTNTHKHTGTDTQTHTDTDTDTQTHTHTHTSCLVIYYMISLAESCDLSKEEGTRNKRRPLVHTWFTGNGNGTATQN